MQLYRIVNSIFFIVPAISFAGKPNLSLLYTKVHEREAQVNRFKLITKNSELYQSTKRVKEQLIKELNTECESAKEDDALLSNYCDNKKFKTKATRYRKALGVCKRKLDEWDPDSLDDVPDLIDSLTGQVIQ